MKTIFIKNKLSILAIVASFFIYSCFFMSPNHNILGDGIYGDVKSINTIAKSSNKNKAYYKKSFENQATQYETNINKLTNDNLQAVEKVAEQKTVNNYYIYNDPWGYDNSAWGYNNFGWGAPWGRGWGYNNFGWGSPWARGWGYGNFGWGAPWERGWGYGNFGWGSPWTRGWGYGNFGWGSPWTRGWGYGNFGWGSPWTRGWGYNNFGFFYDPFYYPYYNGFIPAHRDNKRYSYAKSRRGSKRNRESSPNSNTTDGSTYKNNSAHISRYSGNGNRKIYNTRRQRTYSTQNNNTPSYNGNNNNTSSSSSNRGTSTRRVNVRRRGGN